MPCWKLVRDRVVGEVSGSSGVFVFRVEGSDFEGLLRAKIVEEAMELAASGSVEEAADLLEALYEWLRVKGVSLEDVEALRKMKKAMRGGFSGGYVVVLVDRDEC